LSLSTANVGATALKAGSPSIRPPASNRRADGLTLAFQEAASRKRRMQPARLARPAKSLRLRSGVVEREENERGKSGRRGAI